MPCPPSGTAHPFRIAEFFDLTATSVDAQVAHLHVAMLRFLNLPACSGAFGGKQASAATSSKLPEVNIQVDSQSACLWLTPQVESHEHPLPTLEAKHFLRRDEIRIDTAPHLGGRIAMQVLMRAHLVVPKREFAKQGIQRLAVAGHDLIELLLERQKQPFDAPVLPRASPLDELVLDSSSSQHRAKQGAMEHCRVVGANEVRPA